jgi:hypothetical protein
MGEVAAFTQPPVIHLEQCGTSWHVSVRPCPADQPTLCGFANYETARAHARLIRLEHGWKLVDVARRNG